MSYQAYLDNIKTQTGLTSADFKTLAKDKGLLEPGVKTGQIMAWLKSDIGLGHGHAMAIVLALKADQTPELSDAEKIDALFAGAKSHWRRTYTELVHHAAQLGADFRTDPTDSYISLLKGKKKFAVIAVTCERMDIGLKLKGVTPSGRLGAAGAWNGMVTHRVGIHRPEEVDRQVLDWLGQAYAAA